MKTVLQHTEIKLTSDQEQSLIPHWTDPISLYQHTKEKLSDITNQMRFHKVNKQIHDNKNKLKDKQKETKWTESYIKLEWKYLVVCIQQLLTLNNNNISYHLLAIQIYQTHPISEQEQHGTIQKYVSLAISSCDIGIRLCLLHLNSDYGSFYVWITTFYVLKAQILFQQRKWNQVIQCILPSLKYQQSDNIHLLYNLRASAYCELKQFREAITGKINK